MKFGMVTIFPCEKGQLTIEDIIKLGYDGVELGIKNPKKVRKELIATLQKQKIEVPSILSGRGHQIDKLRFSAASKRIRNNTVKRMEDYIDLASELKSSVLIGHIKGRLDETGSSKRFISYCLQKCDEYAYKKGVNLLLEPLNRYRTDFINTIQEAFYTIEKLRLKNTFIAADTYHINIGENKTVDKAILEAGPYLKHIHVSDNNRKIPGEGCLPWKKFFSSLKKINYDKFISVEAELGNKPYSAAYKAIENLQKWSKE